jgi:hypothetical protein
MKRRSYDIGANSSDFRDRLGTENETRPRWPSFVEQDDREQVGQSK